VEADKVKRAGGRVLTDLVSLVRHALIPSFSLVPYGEELLERYNAWVSERSAAEKFTPEQREWLDRMAANITTSLAIKPEDFEYGWFGQHGSLSHARRLFGDRLLPLMAELNERLAA
jgi:type I restriction enzyme R subunit